MTDLLNAWNQRSVYEELCVLLSKEDSISRYIESEIYIPALTSTMVNFVALKYLRTFLGNCGSDKTM